VDIYASSDQLLRRLERGDWLNAPLAWLWLPLYFERFSYTCSSGSSRVAETLSRTDSSSLTTRLWKDRTNPDEFWREQAPFLTLFRLDDIVRDFIIFRIENNDR